MLQIVYRGANSSLLFNVRYRTCVYEQTIKHHGFGKKTHDLVVSFLLTQQEVHSLQSSLLLTDTLWSNGGHTHLSPPYGGLLEQKLVPRPASG